MSIPMFKKNDPKFCTRAVHVGADPHQWANMEVVPPISLSTTFAQDSPAVFRDSKSSLLRNPSRYILEECISSLEEAKYGLIFASGTAAIMTTSELCGFGDHIISMADINGGTNRFFTKISSRFGVETTFVDCTVAENVEKALRTNTKLIWLETPSNTTLKIVDIQAIANIVHTHNKDAIIAVDNTFMSSYFQRPLLLGADIVVHSCAEYINGHSDADMGALCCNRDDLGEKLRFLQNAVGALPSPFDCYLVNRSLKTLQIRMEHHQKTGFAVARFLENHPCVEKVIHPGLPSHPQFQLAQRQCFGHSGMLSFYIKGDLKSSKRFFENLKIFTLAESLGGHESLTELPCLMTHAAISAEERKSLGITDNLIRLSCGLEATQDLIDDLDQALNKACYVL